MKKNILTFLLSFVVFSSLETLQAADKESEVLMTFDGVLLRVTPFKKSDVPLDYFAINVSKDHIVASLWNGEPVDKNTVIKLLKNTPEGEPCTDTEEFTGFIDGLGMLMTARSVQRREGKEKQDNIQSFMTMLKELAETESMGKIKEAGSFVLQFY